MRDELHDALKWAMDRVAMVGCTCSEGADGFCACDFSSRSERIRAAEIRALIEKVDVIRDVEADEAESGVA